MMEGEEKTPISRPGALYCGQVRDWLNTVYQTNMLQLRMYTAISQQIDWSSLPAVNNTGSTLPSTATFVNHSTSRSSTSSTITTTTTSTTTHQTTANAFPNARLFQAVNAANQLQQDRINNNNITPATTTPSLNILEHRIYTIAPIWKRVVAEMIDFVILLVLKIIVALNAVEMFDIDLDNYEFLLESLNPDSLDVANILDYNAAVQFSSELLIIELMHRVIVCLYEAMCTSRGPQGNQGGATPGKFIMGLRVIRCHQLIPTGGNRILVNPGGNLGFGWALLRSFLKNLSVATMFPLCISLTLDPNTRTVHDFLSNSVVVERH